MLKCLSLAAAAALAAFVAVPGAVPEARAADVTVYGLADVGLSYHDATIRLGDEKGPHTQRWSMDSGNWAGSRFGLKGKEALGNGYTVGFVLENGFSADTGALKTNGMLFDREATLSVSGPFGTLYAGRMGTLMSDAGSVGFYAGAVSPFGTGIGDIGGLYAANVHPAVRVSNAVAYVTPTVNGFTGYAQYAMGDTDENTSKANRYAAVGGKYESGPLTVAALADYLNRCTVATFRVNGYDLTIREQGAEEGYSLTDTWTLNLGGSYDFGAVKVYASGQYFKNAGNPADIVTDVYTMSAYAGGSYVNFLIASTPLIIDAKGGAVSLGLSAPVAGGTAMVSGGWLHGKLQQGTTDDRFTAWTVLAGYEYPLSARTSLYAAAGLKQEKWEWTESTDRCRLIQAATGMVHRF